MSVSVAVCMCCHSVVVCIPHVFTNNLAKKIIQLCDFGDVEKRVTSRFCGTVEYTCQSFYNP